jgi:hypothetical protein
VSSLVRSSTSSFRRLVKDTLVVTMTANVAKVATTSFAWIHCVSVVASDLVDKSTTPLCTPCVVIGRQMMLRGSLPLKNGSERKRDDEDKDVIV